jgi:[protein-PII] uridylyltransferase
MLPRQYASSTTPEDIIIHLGLLASLATQKFNVRLLQKATHWEITVVANDDAALLSTIAGTLTHLELSILSARIFTRVDGKVIDKFWVSVPENKAASTTLEQKLVKELEKNFRLSKEELHDLQARFKPKSLFGKVRDMRMKPTVTFSNTISDNFSTLDLTCSDRMGLLFQVTKVFSEMKLNVHGAILTTEADKAMDAFYFTDESDQKINDAQLIDSIVTTLISELGD